MMETRASYVLVGTFVLALFAAAFGFVLFMARSGFTEAPNVYRIYFGGSVTGLQIGSAVRYRGVPVGSVTDIRIDPENVERVRVDTEIAAGTPVKEDTVATLGLQGVTGVAYIQLSGGSREAATLTAPDRRSVPVIRSQASGIETVLQRAPELLERAVVISERLTELVDDRNIRAVGETLENIRSLTGNLASKGGDIDRAVADSRETFAALRAASESIARLADDMQRRVGPIADGTQGAITDLQGTMADARRTASDFARIAETLNKVIEENRMPFRDFSSNGLYELSQFIAEARVLVSTLTRLSGQIERDPARFFFGDTQKGFEAK
jgi:phospholipid/cholesterol/gamma-HCH transport system substrate-binding protein